MRFNKRMAIALAALTVFLAMVTMISVQSEAQCASWCDNPTMIGEPRLIVDDCNRCLLWADKWDLYVRWIQETDYGCSNGGVCTVTENYRGPCGFCPD